MDPRSGAWQKMRVKSCQNFVIGGYTAGPRNFDAIILGYYDGAKLIYVARTRYPQSNGKIERWHKSLKGECIRPGTPLSLEDARRLVESYVKHYNDVRLNSAIGYITPKDMLAGRQQEIHAERDRKLEEARKQRQIRRQQAA
ncbi:MAG: integrase core domain-containing protein [Candidatus Solibacter sp.]